MSILPSFVLVVMVFESCVQCSNVLRVTMVTSQISQTRHWMNFKHQYSMLYTSNKLLILIMHLLRAVEGDNSSLQYILCCNVTEFVNGLG